MSEDLFSVTYPLQDGGRQQQRRRPDRNGQSGLRAFPSKSQLVIQMSGAVAFGIGEHGGRGGMAV
jgi:hypothetical protein